MFAFKKTCFNVWWDEGFLVKTNHKDFERINDKIKIIKTSWFISQAQNNRELSFKKGDVVYIKKQVDNNWYEGERNGVVGIFPVTYVEILPQNSDVRILKL